MHLLREWSLDYSSAQARQYRWTCAAALWRLADNDSRPDVLAFAVRHLRRLADDRDDYVVTSASYAVRMITPSVPFEEIAPILTILGGSNNRRILQDTLIALDISLSRQPSQVNRLLKQWSMSRRTKVRRTAIHALLACLRVGRKPRYAQLLSALAAEPAIFVDSLQWILEDEESDLSTVMAVLETLATPAPSGFREEWWLH